MQKMNVAVACLPIAAALLLFGWQVRAQDQGQSSYFPYPPGLVPSDLSVETQRVQKEIDMIEARTIQQWRNLPNDSSAAMRQIRLLGKLENFDKNLSVNRNVACGSCHMPYTGFTGPISSLNATTVAYPGSVPYRFGKRKPQSYVYSPFYPELQYNKTQHTFYGGNFWDLRATGYRLQNPDSEQAQGPPHDSQEMGAPDTACVVYRLSQSSYRSLFETVWGAQAFAIQWPADVEQICNTPAGASVFNGNSEPVNLSPTDRGIANSTYDQFAHAITAYEASPEVSAFSSKFDSVLAGAATLTPEEQAGWDLFRGKAQCNTCHLDGTGNNSKNGIGASSIAVSNAANAAPLFTDTTSANLGLPRNPSNPFYYQNTPDKFGFVPNPEGLGFTDLGVGLFLRGLSGTNPNPDWTPLAPKFDGFMQVPTLRDVDMRPNASFIKAYTHNGYLKSLKEVVHFYNTRDAYAYPVQSGACPAGTVEKVNCWPEPEVPQTKDVTIGNLGLTDKEEDEIVASLNTMTDAYTRPYTNANNYTGQLILSGSLPVAYFQTEP